MMKNRFLALLIAAFFPLNLYAGQTIQQFIDAELAPLKNTKAGYGVVIMSAEDGQVIYSANGDLPLAPASNQKVLTTITALATLGPTFQFTTTLGRINGDLVIIGDGDPGFGDPELCTSQPVTNIFDRWAKALTAAGVKEIPGKIIFDDTIFDRQFTHPNWPANQANRWYTAPVAGLNLNDNCMDLSVIFGTDKKPQLVTSPTTEVFAIEPEWIPAKGPLTTIWPIWETPRNLKAKIRLGARGTGPVNITVGDPPLFFAAICRERLQAGGIKITGPIAFQPIRKSDGTLPENFKIIAQYKTPIMNNVFRANKTSQNFFAECLFKRIGYHYAKSQTSFGAGTWTTGQMATKQFLQDQLKVSIDNVFIDDGCGLSKNNRVTANIIAKLLYYARQQPWGEEFRSSLPIAGHDGTLRKRMRGTPASGRVLAKTGFITGASALSGYVMNNQNKPRIIFSMIFNNFPSGKTWHFKGIQDKICVTLAKLLACRPPQEPNEEQETDAPNQNQTTED
jgi:serine-type D-Ala-D-Ala carboxypeptidase/endopeptidase (penicillin-binding protein 4)